MPTIVGDDVRSLAVHIPTSILETPYVVSYTVMELSTFNFKLLTLNAEPLDFEP